MSQDATWSTEFSNSFRVIFKGNELMFQIKSSEALDRMALLSILESVQSVVDLCVTCP